MRQFKFLLAGIILCACQTSITRTNDEDDMKRGVDYAYEFFRAIQANDPEKALSFISESSVTRDDAMKLLTTIKEMRGDLDSVQTTASGSTFTVADGDTTEDQSIQLKCFYTKGTTTEELVLKREAGTLKIVGYQFNL